MHAGLRWVTSWSRLHQEWSPWEMSRLQGNAWKCYMLLPSALIPWDEYYSAGIKIYQDIRGSPILHKHLHLMNVDSKARFPAVQEARKRAEDSPPPQITARGQFNSDLSMSTCTVSTVYKSPPIWTAKDANCRELQMVSLVLNACHAFH